MFITGVCHSPRRALLAQCGPAICRKKQSWVQRPYVYFNFVEDRSFTGKTAESLLSCVASWKTWSDKAGLIESTGKVQVTARGKHNTTALLALCDPDSFTPRQNSAQETEQQDLAYRRLSLLSLLKLSPTKSAKLSCELCGPYMQLGVRAQMWLHLPTLDDGESLERTSGQKLELDLGIPENRLQC